MNYCIIMKYSSEEKCYIVTVPDLPGCMADGKSPNEAYENAKKCDRGMDRYGKGSREGDTGTSFWTG